jgi:predicted Zn-dependent peptidase
MRTRLLFASSLVLFTISCGSTEIPSPLAAPVPSAHSTALREHDAAAAEDASFRKTPPPPGPQIAFRAPKIEEARLPNGIRILLVERHELPIVAVSAVVNRGADQAAPGIGEFTAAMLLSGTKTRSALAISDQLLAIGASYSASADYDMTSVRAQSLTEKVPEMLAIVSDIVQHPAFDKAEVERERSRRLTAIEQRKDNAFALLSDTIADTLYPPDHPYHSPLLGTPDAVHRATGNDLARFHGTHFHPDRMTIAVAGDITKDRAIAEISRVFGGWGAKGPAGKPQPAVAKQPGDPPAAGAEDPRIVLVDRPGATQSHLVVTLPGVPRKTKDYDALLVMNTLFGGAFSSRLNMNLRETHGYTYGARSSFDMRLGPGPFTAGGAIQAESTTAAVREILSEIERLRAELVTPEELEDAKTNLIRQLPARFETANDTAATIGALAVYDLPLDEYATRPERIRRITREDIKRVAETYLLRDRMRLVVVGDAATIEEGLKKLALGPMTIKKAPAKGAKGK